MARQTNGLLSPLLRRLRLGAAGPWVHGRVLDVGCGAGTLARAVPDPSGYVGVDPDPDAIAEARAAGPPGARFLVGDDRAVPATERFDAIVLLAVLEHLRDAEAVVRRLAGRLAPGGRLVATTPTPLGGAVHAVGARARLFSRDAAEEHERMYGERALQRLCATAGLTVERYERFALRLNQLVVARPGG